MFNQRKIFIYQLFSYIKIRKFLNTKNLDHYLNKSKKNQSKKIANLFTNQIQHQFSLEREKTTTKYPSFFYLFNIASANITFCWTAIHPIYAEWIRFEFWIHYKPECLRIPNRFPYIFRDWSVCKISFFIICSLGWPKGVWKKFTRNEDKKQTGIPWLDSEIEV